MVKFGKKFFFDAKYEKKTKRRLIIGGIILVIIIIILIILIVSLSKNNKDKGKKINNDILLRTELTTEVNKSLPDKTSYFEKLSNTDLDKITITYPDNMNIEVNADDCPIEQIDAINSILDGTSDAKLEDYECIKYVPSKIGAYDVKITLDKKDYTVKLNVKDLTAPSLVLKNIEITAGDTYTVNDFVESCNDNYDKECAINYYYNSYEDSNSTLDYSKYTTEGSYDVKIAAGDTSGNLSLPLTATITILPKAPNKYLVTFDTNGGSSINGEYIEEGNVVTKPTNPTRNGYTFKQWTLNGSTYDFATPITSDITLVAEWTKKETKPNNDPVAPGCKYGNKNYDTKKYILSFYANSSSNCAIAKSKYESEIQNLIDNPLKNDLVAKDANRLLSSLPNFNDKYEYGVKTNEVLNTTGKGVVGTQITIYIYEKPNSTLVATYRIDTKGKRHFSLNTINLPQ